MSSENVGVNTGELGRLASELLESGGVVGGSAQVVAENLIGAGEVGSHYPVEGAALRAGLEALGARIAGWSGATVSAAESVAVSVNRQGAADRFAAGEQ
ncbi:hypothetical protein [Nocardia harenae]|uniref:hypothetical protein n=1 Tax=Nocardia harenae TaxID=358707 RepID=UPI00082BE94E|nr:hypothetical protein [Nocardia harenae]